MADQYYPSPQLVQLAKILREELDDDVLANEGYKQLYFIESEIARRAAYLSSDATCRAYIDFVRK